MDIALALFAFAWGVSPFVLVWALIKLWRKAQRLPELQGTLANAERARDSVTDNLTAAREEVQHQQASIEALGKRLLKDIGALGERLLKDNVKFIGSKVTANNFATSKKKFEKVFDFCDKHGHSVPKPERGKILDDLKRDFEEAVRKQWQKEEQARIKRQIREEEKLEAERQRELQRLDSQALAIGTALQKAKDEVEVQRLREELEEALAKLERAKSMAELTRAGFVYVISNVGSLGEGVFKVGMTRRLEPLDRVRELGDASVPFRYDVHMMISSDDAPALENALHQGLHKYQVNKVNPRKEFFKVGIDTIVRLAEKHHGKVDYVASPEALEYNESLNMSDEDFGYVSGELAKFDEDEEGYRPSASPQSPVSPRTREERVEDRPRAEAARVPVASAAGEGSTSPDAAADRVAASEPPKEEGRTVACPRCKGSIPVDTLVNGDNTCPHCSGRFKVKRNS